MFLGFTKNQLRDMYFYYINYRDRYCADNKTCKAEIGIGEFYGLK